MYWQWVGMCWGVGEAFIGSRLEHALGACIGSK